MIASRNADLVDKAQNPDSLFWKLDFILDHQPPWMHAKGQRTKFNLVNPRTHSTIDGAATTGHLGRGGRRTGIMVDEHAAYEITAGYEAVEASQFNANCRLFNSTPLGPGRAYDDLCNNPDMKQIRLHWPEHPEKRAGLYTSEGERLIVKDKSFIFPREYRFILDGKLRSPFYDRECERANNPQEVARELDMDSSNAAFRYFDAAVFTNLTPEHLDYHGDMENYYQAKKLLFTRHLKSGGVSILNLDDEPGRRLAKELPGPILSYGLAEPAEVRPLEYRTEISGTELKLAGGAIHSPLSGDYNALNVLAAVAGARSCGIKDGVIQQAIEAFPGVPGRLQRVPNTRNLNIFIDYAHTSDALLNVLKNIRPLCSGESKLIAVFGCGGDRDSSKRPVMGGIAARLADKLVITSDNPRHEDPAAIIEQIMKGIPAETTVHSEIDRGRAIAYAVAHARGGDTILVAGKGHEDCQEIKGVKHPFNDYDCIRAALVRASQEQTKV